MKKKYLVEFGMRGGVYSTSNVLKSRRKAQTMAASLVAWLPPFNVLSAEAGKFPKGLTGSVPQDWIITEEFPRLVWVSPNHFVSLSLLDGVPRGPASAKYWRRMEEISEPVMERYAKYQPLFD